MCGIVGVVRRRSHRALPDTAELVGLLDAAVDVLAPDAPTGAGLPLLERLTAAGTIVHEVDDALRGTPGLRALLGDPTGTLVIEHRVERLGALLDDIEAE